MSRVIPIVVFLLLWSILGYAMFGVGASPAPSRAASDTSARRIVSMAPNLTEILFALDLGDRVAAVTTDSDYPVSTSTLPKAGSFWQPNVEAIISARPDLILTLDFTQQQTLAQRLRRIGFECLTLKIEQVGDVFSAIEAIGARTGVASRATDLTDAMRNRFERLRSGAAREDRPKILWVVQREPLRVAGRDTFVNELIELAGGTNAIGPTIHKYPPIGAEQVLACGADVIIEPAMVGRDLAGQREQAGRHWRQYPSLPAAKNKRVYVIDGDTVSRLGPRLCEGAEAIARCLWPPVEAP